MSGSPGSSGSNPRKFSEKIALHNQKQAEETRAFEQLMTDLTVSRVQYQKIQQLRLSQNRAQYYGGSLPNVNQIGNASTDFQGVFPSGLDSVRGTRHHGLVERVHRDRNRINSPHRRPIDKHGRQISFKFTAIVLSVLPLVLHSFITQVDEVTDYAAPARPFWYAVQFVYIQVQNNIRRSYSTSHSHSSNALVIDGETRVVDVPHSVGLFCSHRFNRVCQDYTLSQARQPT
ncbi:unnamed protein product [Leuciscus chuanchicus]